MRFLLGILSNLRKGIPFLLGSFGMIGGAIVAGIQQVNFELFLGIGFVVGYVLGFFIRKIIPDPDDMAL